MDAGSGSLAPLFWRAMSMAAKTQSPRPCNTERAVRWVYRFARLALPIVVPLILALKSDNKSATSATQEQGREIAQP